MHIFVFDMCFKFVLVLFAFVLWRLVVLWLVCFDLLLVLLCLFAVYGFDWCVLLWLLVVVGVLIFVYLIFGLLVIVCMLMLFCLLWVFVYFVPYFGLFCSDLLLRGRWFLWLLWASTFELLVFRVVSFVCCLLAFGLGCLVVAFWFVTFG